MDSAFQTSLAFLRFPWDRFIDRIMNGGVSPISSVAILSSLIFPVKESKGSELNQETRIILAQRNLGKLSESNARVVVTKTKNGSLHKEILKLTPEKQCNCLCFDFRSHFCSVMRGGHASPSVFVPSQM
jgi:hypothetical protein